MICSVCGKEMEHCSYQSLTGEMVCKACVFQSSKTQMEKEMA